MLNIANVISENNKQVVWCEPDFYNSFRTTQDDPLYDQQYYLHNTGQNGGTSGIDINTPAAWAITLGSSNLRVAVIDVGVENHEDFNGRVLSGYTAGLNVTVDIANDYHGYFHSDGFAAPQIPVICNDSPGKVILSEWGYLPGKVKDEKDIKAFRYKFKTLNAKADTFTTSRMFKSAFEKRRCLILVTGFYEYRHENCNG